MEIGHGNNHSQNIDNMQIGVNDAYRENNHRDNREYNNHRENRDFRDNKNKNGENQGGGTQHEFKE